MTSTQFIFFSFTVLYPYRQEVVAALVSHAGSPVEREKDSAFSILLYISNLESKVEERARGRKILIERKTKLTNAEQCLQPTLSTRYADVHNNNKNNNSNYDSNSHDNNVTLRDFGNFLKTLFEDIGTLSEEQLRSLFYLIFQNSCIASEVLREGDCHNSNGNNNNNNNNNDNNSNNNDSRSSINCDNNGNNISNILLTKPSKRSLWAFRPPDDVMILLKKYSGSMERRLRRISIIGYVAYLSQSRAFYSSLERLGANS